MKNVQRLEEQPVASGAYVDVHRGRVNEKYVCLKIVRAYQTSSYERILKVHDMPPDR